jgi:hypothetical protein
MRSTTLCAYPVFRLRSADQRVMRVDPAGRCMRNQFHVKALRSCVRYSLMLSSFSRSLSLSRCEWVARAWVYRFHVASLRRRSDLSCHRASFACSNAPNHTVLPFTPVSTFSRSFKFVEGRVRVELHERSEFVACVFFF